VVRGLLAVAIIKCTVRKELESCRRCRRVPVVPTWLSMYGRICIELIISIYARCVLLCDRVYVFTSVTMHVKQSMYGQRVITYVGAYVCFVAT
jgi:hypothetical protein